MNKYTITALLANKSGVLTRLSGLFARRGFNIDSISACATEDANFSRVTIVFTGDEYTLSQMTKQLDKLIDVKKITLADEKDSVLRELLLVKVSAPADKRSELIEIKEVYKAKIVDLSPKTAILELTGEPNKLDGWRDRPLARRKVPERPRGLQRVDIKFTRFSASCCLRNAVS